MLFCNCSNSTSLLHTTFLLIISLQQSDTHCFIWARVLLRFLYSFVFSALWCHRVLKSDRVNIVQTNTLSESLYLAAAGCVCVVCGFILLFSYLFSYSPVGHVTYVSVCSEDGEARRGGRRVTPRIVPDGRNANDLTLEDGEHQNSCRDTLRYHKSGEMLQEQLHKGVCDNGRRSVEKQLRTESCRLS